MRRRSHSWLEWLGVLACTAIVAGAASVVAVAASSPGVTSAPAPRLFGGTFTSSALNAQPDCHAGFHDYDAVASVPMSSKLVCNDDDGDVLTFTLVSGPSHGSVTLNADGTFTYTANAGYAGDDSFDFKATDPGGLADTGTANVSVVATGPGAASDLGAVTASTTEIDLSWTAGTDATSYAVLRAASSGGPYSQVGTAATTTFADTGLTPGTKYFYVVRAQNGNGEAADSNEASATTLLAAPTGLAASGVSTSEIDLSWTASAGATSYRVLRSSAGAGPYTQVGTSTSASFADTGLAPGTRYFYVVEAVTADATSPRSSQASAVTLLAAPTALTATPVSTTRIDLSWTAPTGATAYTLSRSLTATGPYQQVGTLSTTSFSDTGRSPHTTYFYVVTATTAETTSPQSNEASATTLNTTPTAANDSYQTNEDTALTIAAPGLLGNDADADGDALTAAKVTSPAHGTATVNASGSFTYTPAANFNGNDTFTYTASDGHGGSATAAVTIRVLPVNDAPVANAQSVTLPEDPVEPKAITLTADDVEHDALTFSIVDGPVHGKLNGSGADRTYTPELNYNGPDSFTFKANDGSVDSNVATVSLTVTPVNDAPVAKDDPSATTAYSVTGNTPFTLPARGVLVNDTDVDSDPLTLTAVKFTNPQHGTVTLNANGSFTYTPNHDFADADSFTYKAFDGVDRSKDPATVYLDVSQPAKFVLSVGRAGTGTGLVTSSPLGINCGADCTYAYTKDTLVTLTASPASSSAFAGWTGGCTGTSLTCVVTMDAAKTVTATFVKQHWDLKVSQSGGGGGTVVSVPAGINCGATCTASYDDGTVVTLTATPDPSSTFEKWSGACSGTSNVCTLTISGSANAVAQFKAKKTPPPKVGETVVGGPVSGKVTYKLPGSSTFVPLTGDVQFPNGTVVNAKDGVVSIASAEGNGTIDHAQVWAGIFQLHTYVYTPLALFSVRAKKLYGTEFKLVEKLACTTAALQATKKRKLWGSGKGKFRTKGRYSAATVRGTKWYVEDRCDGTLTKVAKGIVEVQDLVRKKLVLVKAGHSYFASAKASARPKKAKKG